MLTPTRARRHARSLLLTALAFLIAAAPLLAQPETPVEEWTDRTVLVVGAHPDDDSHAHGTMSLLEENGNEVWLLTLTTGNVGTKDPDLSRGELSEIRRREQLAALAELGIPEDRYIQLGYTDGLVQFADQKELVRRIVYWIRKLQPDVLIGFDPGKGYQTWHKTDHRAAAYRAVDAARAAEWPLLFQNQIVHEGLEAHRIEKYLLFDGVDEDRNTFVDISGHVEARIAAHTRYVSQFSSGWYDYEGPDLPQEELEEMRQDERESIEHRDGAPVEGFRYYEGYPDRVGK